MANLLTTFGTLQQRTGIPDARDVARPVDAGDVPTDVMAALRDMELLASGDVPRVALVPSTRTARVYRVELGWGTVCMKLALPHGDAVVDAFTSARAAAEVAWFKLACNVVPGAAPVVLGAYSRRAAFATDYLDPAGFPTWESRIAAGEHDPWFATELGHLLGRLHAASAHSRSLSDRFAMQTAFQALRLQPAFQRIALELPNGSARLVELAERLATTRIALVHGGLIPENVLIGPRGPVLIGAGCAHYGDPMFDVASCIAALAAHMVLQIELRAPLAASLEAFRQSYFSHLTWEIPEHAEARAARLVPALIAAHLAAQAGTSSTAHERARAVALAMLARPPTRVTDLARAWQRGLGDDRSCAEQT